MSPSLPNQRGRGPIARVPAFSPRSYSSHGPCVNCRKRPNLPRLLILRGIDPDSVELIGAKVTPEGTLAVSPKTTSLTVVGRQYTISWAATFDNGGHACRSELTPENTTPKPFVVTVAG